MARVAITKGHKMGHLTEVCHLTVLEARSPEIKVPAGLVPSEDCEGHSAPGWSLASGGWLASSGIPGLIEASPRSLPSSSHGVPLTCMSMLKFLLFIRMLGILNWGFS